MKWLIENWSLLVVLFAVVVLLSIYVKKFVEMPSEEQIGKVKEWLLYAVVMAEKELGGGTGQIKLRYVYDLFVSKFPEISKLIPFATFALWVDDALEQMKHLLETNKDIACYVEGE